MPSKYDAINKIKDEAGESITWTEAARKAGFDGEWTSKKGKAARRTGDSRGQSKRRRQFDVTSTPTADYETKQLEIEVSRINREAAMYGLEPLQIEHILDQSDAKLIESGAAGDPTNKIPVKTSDARFKDRVRQIVGDDYAVTLNPAKESVKIIDKKVFDPIVDPDLLPGTDIPIGSDFDFNKGGAKLNRNLSKFGKSVSKILPGSLDDAIIGGVLATGAAGATLLTGGSPAQAGEAFLETGVDVATGDLQGGNLADGTLQTNLDKVENTLYQEPVNIAAPTGVTTFDSVAQPLIKGLAGQPMGLKRSKGSIVFGF